MKSVARVSIIAACLALGACWTRGDDQEARNVEQQHENKADQLDAAAENAGGDREDQLESNAEATREAGEEAAEAIDDNDVTNSNAR